MKNKLKIIFPALLFSLLIGGNTALASEITGTLTTGINSTVGNTLQGVVGENISLGSANAGETNLPTGATSVVLTDTTELDLSAGLSGGAVTLQSGVDNQPIILINSSLSYASASIPDGTKIQGPAGWDGKMAPPTSGTPSGGNAPAGFSVGSTVISIGSTEGTLVFDKPVTISLAGVTGAVGYRPSGSNAWVQITNACGGSYATPTPPALPGECAISNGTDTKIVTYHFTSFGSLTANPAPTPTPSQTSSNNSSGSFSSGGGYTPVTATVGISNFVALMANWGKTGVGISGDLNGDGKVDIIDFVWLMANWTI